MKLQPDSSGFRPEWQIYSLHSCTHTRVVNILVSHLLLKKTQEIDSCQRTDEESNPEYFQSSPFSLNFASVTAPKANFVLLITQC